MVKKLDMSLRPVWYEGDSDYILAPWAQEFAEFALTQGYLVDVGTPPPWAWETNEQHQMRLEALWKKEVARQLAQK